MLHSPVRKGHEKTGKGRVKFSAVSDSIRGKWKAIGHGDPHADPGSTSFLSSSHITPVEQ